MRQRRSPAIILCGAISAFLFLGTLAPGCSDDETNGSTGDDAGSDTADNPDTAGNPDTGDNPDTTGAPDTADNPDATDNDIDGQDAGTDTGGSDSIEDCDLGAAAFGRPFGMFEDHRLHFVGRDGDTTQVRVARTYIEVGVGESAIYELAGMAIAHDGEVVCVTDGVALGYENTHHNWMDTATATHGAFRYQLTLSFVVGPDDPEEVFEITAMDAPDRIAWGPVRLDLANP